MNSKSISTAKIICLAGATASGKSAAARELCGRFELEVFSVDSMQVYRGLDIGTAKPEPAQRATIHMLDCADPGQKWTVADYCSQVLSEIDAGQNRNLLFVGGTGLYFEALFKGLAPIPPVSAEIAQGLAGLNSSQLAQALCREDPAAAARTDLKNPRRVSRALGVLRSSGHSILHWQEQTRPLLTAPQMLWLFLDPATEVLHKSIEARCRNMYEQGWPLEAFQAANRWGEQALLQTGAIGYKQALKVYRGEQDSSSAMAEVIALTRQYSRRQRSWWRNRSQAEYVQDGKQALGLADAFLQK
jgi:tRNA dimethylallyltransferase